MTVQELIEQLKSMPQDAEVITPGTDGIFEFYGSISEPRIIEVAMMKDNPNWAGLYVEKDIVEAAGNNAKVATEPVQKAVAI